MITTQLLTGGSRTKDIVKGEQNKTIILIDICLRTLDPSVYTDRILIYANNTDLTLTKVQVKILILFNY